MDEAKITLANFQSIMIRLNDLTAGLYAMRALITSVSDEDLQSELMTGLEDIGNNHNAVGNAVQEMLHEQATTEGVDLEEQEELPEEVMALLEALGVDVR